MEFREYQVYASKTAIYPEQGSLQGLIYTSLGLAGESGEQANKVKKILRDDKSILTEKKKEELSKELGGILWYIAQMATELGLDLSTIACHNIDILASRAERGKLTGSGDNR